MNRNLLTSQLKYGLLNNDFVIKRITEFGIKIDQVLPIIGANAETKDVIVGWQVERNKTIRLIIAYLAESKKQTGTMNYFSYYVLPEEKSYCEKVFKIADTIAQAKAGIMIPTPLFIKDDPNTYTEGLCGYAYLIFDGRTRFGKWVKKRDEGSFHNQPILESPLETQSYDRNVTYIEAFYEVLELNDISCKIKKYYD